MKANAGLKNAFSLQVGLHLVWIVVVPDSQGIDLMELEVVERNVDTPTSFDS